MDTVFNLSAILVFPFWVLMIFVPKWSWTRRIVDSPLIATPAAVLYVVLLIPVFGDVLLGVLTPSLADIGSLLSSPRGTSIAWAHFLAFDVFVGRWVYLDSRDSNRNVFVMAPILFLVLMLGPLGLLLYLGVRTLYRTSNAD